MMDNITRNSETEAIIQFVGVYLHHRESGNEPVTIMDVGCGNGYTLEQLAKRYPGNNFVGIEKSDDLRSLALSRPEGQNCGVEILRGDIRQSDFAKGIAPDILIRLRQRVLINLPTIEDQKSAKQYCCCR